MPRFMLNDQHWVKLSPIFMQQDIYHKPNLRLTVEAILYRMRVGCPWRDLPPEFGRWNSLYKRYNDWSAKGVFQSIFRTLSADSDTEWVFIEGSYVKAHQHSAGAASHDQQTLVSPDQTFASTDFLDYLSRPFSLIRIGIIMVL